MRELLKEILKRLSRLVEDYIESLEALLVPILKN